jgi:hypothetical protein
MNPRVTDPAARELYRRMAEEIEFDPRAEWKARRAP